MDEKTISAKILNAWKPSKTLNLLLENIDDEEFVNLLLADKVKIIVDDKTN